MTRLARDLLRAIVKARRGWYCVSFKRRFRKDERAALAELSLLGFVERVPDGVGGRGFGSSPGLRDGAHIFIVTSRGDSAFSRKTKRDHEEALRP